MPIHINLLAEAHAIEDSRRRDPVKRAIWAGSILVILALGAISFLQAELVFRSAELKKVQGQIATRSSEFQQVIANQQHLVDVSRKLGALQQMATNRFLYGTLLNALQQTTIDDVQLARFRVDQSYLLTDEVKAKTNEDRIIPGRPGTSTEKIVLTLDAKDSGPNPGDQVNKFKQNLADSAYFQSMLGKTNEVRLTSLSPPMGVDGKAFVQFSLECRFPEKTR